MEAEKRLEAARNEANLNNSDSMKELFNASANNYYLSNTKKTFEELSAYLSYGQSSWADGCRGNEWESVEDCIMCAEEAASQALEAEKESK